MPASVAKIAEESESVRRSAAPGRARRIGPKAANRLARDHGMKAADGKRASSSVANAPGPRNTAGRETSSADALTTGSAWIRSPSQLGRRTRSGEGGGGGLFGLTIRTGDEDAGPEFAL
jgi:hypothetical protein